MAGGHSGSYQHLRREEMHARELCIEALVKIDGHVEECNRRDEVFQRQYVSDMFEIKRGLEAVHSRVSSHSSKFNKWIIGLGGAIIVGLLGIIGFLIVYGPPWRPFVDPS